MVREKYLLKDIKGYLFDSNWLQISLHRIDIQTINLILNKYFSRTCKADISLLELIFLQWMAFTNFEQKRKNITWPRCEVLLTMAIQLMKNCKSYAGILYRIESPIDSISVSLSLSYSLNVVNSFIGTKQIFSIESGTMILFYLMIWLK